MFTFRKRNVFDYRSRGMEEKFFCNLMIPYIENLNSREIKKSFDKEALGDNFCLI
jgi:hypothetical protein